MDLELNPFNDIPDVELRMHYMVTDSVSLHFKRIPDAEVARGIADLKFRYPGWKVHIYDHGSGLGNFVIIPVGYPLHEVGNAIARKLRELHGLNVVLKQKTNGYMGELITVEQLTPTPQ